MSPLPAIPQHTCCLLISGTFMNTTARTGIDSIQIRPYTVDDRHDDRHDDTSRGTHLSQYFETLGKKSRSRVHRPIQYPLRYRTVGA